MVGGWMNGMEWILTTCNHVKLKYVSDERLLTHFQLIGLKMLWYLLSHFPFRNPLLCSKSKTKGRTVMKRVKSQLN